MSSEEYPEYPGARITFPVDDLFFKNLLKALWFKGGGFRPEGDPRITVNATSWWRMDWRPEVPQHLDHVRIEWDGRVQYYETVSRFLIELGLAVKECEQ